MMASRLIATRPTLLVISTESSRYKTQTVMLLRLKYLSQHTDKPGITATIRDLKPIEEAYARLPLVDAGPAKAKSSSEDAIVIGKDKKIQITEDNFNLLKARISQVRQALTDNK